MIKKIMLISVPCLIMGLCLFFSISAYLRYRDNYVEVYVASHNIAQRTMLKEEDLLQLKVPKDYLGDDVYTAKEDMLGKYVKLSYSIPKGSLIYRSSLESDIKDLSGTLLKNGEVNFDIFTGEVKINSAILSVNMYVDLYLTIGNLDKAYSDLLLEGCRITGLYDNQGRLIKAYDTEAKAAIVSIAIPKKDVVILNKALVLGNISVLSGSNVYDTNNQARLNEDSFLMDYLNDDMFEE